MRGRARTHTHRHDIHCAHIWMGRSIHSPRRLQAEHEASLIYEPAQRRRHFRDGQESGSSRRTGEEGQRNHGAVRSQQCLGTVGARGRRDDAIGPTSTAAAVGPTSPPATVTAARRHGLECSRTSPAAGAGSILHGMWRPAKTWREVLHDLRQVRPLILPSQHNACSTRPSPRCRCLLRTPRSLSTDKLRLIWGQTGEGLPRWQQLTPELVQGSDVRICPPYATICHYIYLPAWDFCGSVYLASPGESLEEHRTVGAARSYFHKLWSQ